MQEEGWEFIIEFLSMVIFGSFTWVVDSKDWGKGSQERLKREKWESRQHFQEICFKRKKRSREVIRVISGVRRGFVLNWNNYMFIVMRRFSREWKTCDAGDFKLNKSFSQNDTYPYDMPWDPHWYFPFFSICSVLFHSVLVMLYKIGSTTQGLKKSLYPTMLPNLSFLFLLKIFFPW